MGKGGPRWENSPKAYLSQAATTVEVAAQPGPDRAGKLDRKVVMVGDLTRFELWDEQIWEAYLDKQAAAGLPEDLGDIPGL